MTDSTSPSARLDTTELVRRVARAIFEANRDFYVVTSHEPLPERHFKVSVALYEAMAREAIAVVRQADAGK
jgi:hypothetical protein